MLGGLLSAGLGIGGGLFSTISGAIQAREAREALQNYERQELQNMAEGLQASTLGSDLAREEAGRLAMGQVDALQAGGQRTLLGGLGRVEARNTDLNRQIGADLDMQQRQIDQQVMAENQRIRQMQEQRENADIAALSSQINTGNQNMMGGIGNIIQGAGMMGGILGTKPEQPDSLPVPFGTPGFDTSAIGQNPQSTNSFIGTKTGGSGMGATARDYLNFGTDPLLVNQTYGRTPVVGNPRSGGLGMNPRYTVNEYGELIF
jgi:hypothetical protein